MPQSVTFPREAEDALHSMLERTSDRLDAFKASIQSAKHFRAVLKELLDHVSQNRPLHVLSLMEKHDSLAKEQCDSGHHPLDEWKKIREKAEEQAKKLLIWYPKLLEEACKDAGLDLDMTSRHPTYTFDDCFFELKVDRTGMAELFSYGRRFARFPGDIEAVVERVKEKRTSLFDRPFEPKKFLRQFRTAYVDLLAPAGRPDGESVPIREILHRMTRKGAEHSLEEFVVDLARLVTEGPLEIDHRKLELEHTRDQDQGILLHHVDTFGYIGFARFREVGA